MLLIAGITLLVIITLMIATHLLLNVCYFPCMCYDEPLTCHFLNRCLLTALDCTGF